MFFRAKQPTELLSKISRLEIDHQQQQTRRKHCRLKLLN